MPKLEAGLAVDGSRVCAVYWRDEEIQIRCCRRCNGYCLFESVWLSGLGGDGAALATETERTCERL